MTYGTSHLLKRGWGGGESYHQKRPQCKNARKKCKKLSNIEIISLFPALVLLTQHFTKFIFLEQLTAMPQINKQNMFFFVFFFLSSHQDTLNAFLSFSLKNIIIYRLILTVNHQGSHFPFFGVHPVGQTFLYPSKFLQGSI